LSEIAEVNRNLLKIMHLTKRVVISSFCPREKLQIVRALVRRDDVKKTPHSAETISEGGGSG
jgi:hypothetical protein